MQDRNRVTLELAKRVCLNFQAEGYMNPSGRPRLHAIFTQTVAYSQMTIDLMDR